MKKLSTSLIVLSLFIFGINGQNIANYTFSTTKSAILENMTSGTTQLIGPSTINVISGMIDIGFPFYFMGVPYMQFSVNSNGQLRLGDIMITANGITDPAANTPVLVPISGSNAILSSGKVHYKIKGSSPDRVLIIEWRDLNIPFPIVDNNPPILEYNPSQLQVFLYESTGIIEFRYGTVSNNSVPTITKATFISSGNTSNTVKYIGADLISAVDASIVVAYPMDTINTNLLNQRMYSFNPPAAPVTPTWKTDPLTSVTVNSFVLNWNDLSTNETGFLIYRSDDGGITFSYVATAPANATSYTITGLQSTISYIWKLAAVNEGAASSFIQLVQPIAPIVTVINNCDSTSTLAATNYTGTLLWNTLETTDTISVDVAGVYSVTQTVNGISSLAGFGIAAPKNTPGESAGVSIAVNQNPVNKGIPVTFTATPTGGGVNPIYQWYIGSSLAGTNSNTYTYNPTDGDIIKVVLTSNAPCVTGSPATSNRITMSVSLGTYLNSNKTKIDIYSNDKFIIVNSTERVKQINIYNSLGSMILLENNVTVHERYNLNNYSTGYYFVKIVTDHNVYSQKVLLK